MNCLRASDIEAGSRLPVALPTPTPLRHISKPLGKGAIAGIAVGVVIGIALIVGVGVWFCMERTSKCRAENKKRDAEEIEAKMKIEIIREQTTKEAKAPMLDSEVKHEMGAGIGTMIGGGDMYELELQKGRAGEIDGEPVNELPGSSFEPER